MGPRTGVAINVVEGVAHGAVDLGAALDGHRDRVARGTDRHHPAGPAAQQQRQINPVPVLAGRVVHADAVLVGPLGEKSAQGAFLLPGQPGQLRGGAADFASAA